MPLAPATTLQQRYRIVHTIGSGGMGTVYLAEDMRLGGRHCAIKEHRPDPALDAVDLAKLRRQFEQREARILAELDHPNLPKVFDYFSDGGNDYLVMEFVAGDNLQIELSRHMNDFGKPLPEKVVLIWAQQVLDALHYLHSRPTGAILHRDIKPANIILASHGRIKLVDFGLAKLMTATPSDTQSRSLQLLTPQYASPEQFMLGTMDERSDIFAFGATLYHLLTGNPPPDAQHRAFGDAEMRPARELRPEVSEPVSEALTQACALKKEARFASASLLAAALDAVPIERRSLEAVETIALPGHASTPVEPSPTVRMQPPTALEQQALIARMQDRSLPIKERAEAGDRLAAIGDPRPGVGLRADGLPDIAWLEVGAGRVVIEDGIGTKDVDAFQIAKYEVTYAQYKAFLDASDGYSNDAWWTMDPPLAERQAESGEQYWPVGNRPAETVSWYGAMAFTRWLTYRLLTELRDGQVIRLPTEGEWVHAAYGPDMTGYPWGDKYAEGLSNVDQLVGATTAVGMFPQGAAPSGAEDMTGNVWEWTLSEYDGGNDGDITNDRARVVRGGSWCDFHLDARAGFREGFDPDFRFDFVGFRVVLAAPVP